MIQKAWKFIKEYSEYYQKDLLLNLYWSGWIFASILAIIYRIRSENVGMIIEYSIALSIVIFCLVHSILLTRNKQQENNNE